MIKVLVTGANGFLGHYLVHDLLEAGYEVIATGKGPCRLPYKEEHFHYAPMDYTDPYAVHDVFEKYQPGIVVHAGAISKPDDCELDQWMAFVNNVEATVTLLSNAADISAFFIFLSTDFIFDGVKGMYREEDAAAPVNYYGQTKLEAEDAVKDYEHDWAIVRTVLVYGKPTAGRPNIISIVREKLEKGEGYQVVDDQVRTPTYVEDLSAGILQIIQLRAKGIFHLAGKDVLTPYQMAIQTARALGLNEALLQRVTAADFTQPAKRPAKTGFIIEKARRELNYEPVSFEEGLKKTLAS